MIDRWYYIHGGQTLGPVTAAQLRQLAVSGGLGPDDLVWPDGRPQSDAVPAHAVVDLQTLAPPLAHKPDWLDDLRAAARIAAKPPEPANPDWLDDVRATEESERARMTTFEWDGESPPTDEETAAKKILDQLDADSVRMPKSEPSAKASAPAPRRLVLGSATTRGRVRDHNEDSLLVQQFSWSHLAERHDVALIVVADGMGGHAAGDRASGMLVRVLGGVLSPLVTAAMTRGLPQPPERAAEALERGLQEANRLIRQTAQENAVCKGMGSTAVALVIWDGKAVIRLVGDCRVYLWHGGKLTQATRDQTLVARMVELGQLTPEEAAIHPRRNEVTQAVGKYALIEPGRYELVLEGGDWLIVSSDGLSAHVNDATLEEVIAKAGSSAANLADRLVELANQAGGSDNCTVVAVRCV